MSNTSKYHPKNKPLRHHKLKEFRVKAEEKFENMNWKASIRGINQTEFNMQTYQDAYRYFTYNDLVEFTETEVPLIGWRVESYSEIDKFNTFAEAVTKQQAYRSVFTQLLNAIYEAENENA